MSGYLDLVFLLAVAVLIFARLYRVLGARPEDDGQTFMAGEDFLQKHPEIVHEIENQLKVKLKSAEDVDGVDAVLYKIPGFLREDFCAKAAKTFEMVLTAFAAEDLETLKMLTTPKLFAKFKDIIASRQEEGLKAETDLIRIEDVCVENAEISDTDVAQIVVKFVSEQINLLRNKLGEIVEGDENYVQKITDFWTFEKDVTNMSPVWLLTSTKKKS